MLPVLTFRAWGIHAKCQGKMHTLLSTSRYHQSTTKVPPMYYQGTTRVSLPLGWGAWWCYGPPGWCQLGQLPLRNPKGSVEGACGGVFECVQVCVAFKGLPLLGFQCQHVRQPMVGALAAESGCVFRVFIWTVNPDHPPGAKGAPGGQTKC